ncbi:MAG: acetyl-CoA carboxylase, carboxyltransferase subunit beta [Pseudomonadota bacterium]
MNWINNLMRPKIRSFLTTKREVPDNLWQTCPLTGQMVFHKDLEANQFVFPGSEYHERMTAAARLEALFDDGVYDRVPVPDVAIDPLKFRDSRRYTDRLKDAKAKTELDDAVVVGEGKLDGRHVVSAVQDFNFMAGSLGMAAGEALIAGMLHAAHRKAPFILFAASGGARMQEGIMSLMQMPRVTIAVQRLREAGLPYLVVLTNPTTGGVTASYAMLGDVQIAEPGALICFAGPRVIQQTIRESLPDGFQRSEYLLEHGMIDMVVHRHQLRETLSKLAMHFMSAKEHADAKATDAIAAKSALNGKPSKAAADLSKNTPDIVPEGNGKTSKASATNAKPGDPATKPDKRTKAAETAASKADRLKSKDEAVAKADSPSKGDGKNGKANATRP